MSIWRPFALNQAIRQALRRGQPAPPPEHVFATDTGPRAFGAGDRIFFTRNDKDLGVKNGLLGTVEDATPDSLTIRLDGEEGETRCITLDPQCYVNFDYGYAVTIHKSQGATVDRAYVLVSRRIDEPLTYVAMTRHREQLRVYLNGQDRPKWAALERHPSMVSSLRREARDHGPSWQSGK